MEIEVKEKGAVRNYEEVAKIFRAILEAESFIDRDKEHFWVMGVNGHLRIKYIEIVTLGLLENTIFHPREVFRFAIIKGVAGIILAHNHPSGEIEPSKEDDDATFRLVKAGELLGIPVLDHIIIADGQEQCYSFAAKGRITSKFCKSVQIKEAM